jgi:hypothetical protein
MRKIREKPVKCKSTKPEARFRLVAFVVGILQVI